MIVSICALAGMYLARVDLKNTGRSNDLQEAQLLANSAVELAVSTMNYAPTQNNIWRSVYHNGVEESRISVGNGSMSFKLVDDDGSLTDDVTDPVWIYGYGRVGDAVWVQRAWARNDRGQPLECLNTAIHCSGQLQVKGGGTVTVAGAPASTDGRLQIDGAIKGDAQAVTLTGGGTISGTKTVPAPRKGVPWPTLFTNYVARATQITYRQDITNVVLAPGINEVGGGLNAKGIYYINTASGDLKLSNMRLLGTLVIDASPSGWVTIDKSVFMQPARADFPALIIKGTAALQIDSTGSQYLSESSQGHNFNPSGAPYLGVTNTNTADNYPNEVRGLIHVIGNVFFWNNGIYRGAVLVQGAVTVESDSPQIIWDRNLIMNPPLGYSSNPTSTSMIMQSQTWARQASP
jgi:hypothetical protein